MLVGSAALYEATLTFVEVDVLGHLKFGFDILKSGVVTSVDPYSFMTRGAAWINHEWLSQVIFAFFFEHCGWTGDICLKALVVLATIALVSWALIRNKADAFTTSALILLAVFLLGPSIRTMRPHIFTLLALSALFVTLKQTKEKPRVYPLWFPALFVVWPNLHGAFVTGLVSIFVWTLTETASQWRYPASRPILKKNWLICVICALATLINPYGPQLFNFVLNTQSSFFSDPGEISEWQPITITSVFGLAYILTLLVSIISICFTRKKRDLPSIVLWSFYALSPLISIRHLALFSLATFILLGDCICELIMRRPADNSKKNMRMLYIMGAISFLVSATLFVFALRNTMRLEVSCSPPLDLPAKAVFMLKQVHAEGNILCDLEWGEYILWHLGPQLKVSIDGRTQVVYPPVVRLVNRYFREGIFDWDIILKKFPLDFILLEKETPSFNLMKLYPGWTLVFEDEHSALFCPKNSRYAEQLQILAKDPQTAANVEPVFLNTRLK